MARQVLIRARNSAGAPAFTVNQACGSGLQAILLAAERIRAKRARVVVAGGAESMTRVPYLLDRARMGYRLGNAALVDGMYRDGFLDPICGLLMGETAEKLADLYHIPREEQDAYALESPPGRGRDQAGRFHERDRSGERPARAGRAISVLLLARNVVEVRELLRGLAHQKPADRIQKDHPDTCTSTRHAFPRR